MAREAIKLGFEKAGTGIRYRKMYKGEVFTSPVYPQESRRNKSEAWGLFVAFRDEIDAAHKALEEKQLAADPIRLDTTEKIQTFKAVAEMVGDEAGERWASNVLKLLKKTDALGVEQIREELELDDNPDPLLDVGKKLAEAKKSTTKEDDLTCHAQAEVFRSLMLSKARTEQISFGRYGKIDSSLQVFVDWYGEKKSLRHLSESTVSGYYAYLLKRIADGDNSNTMSDHFAVAKQFIAHCCEDNSEINLPRNLYSKKYKIQRIAREPDPFTKSEITLLMEHATEQTKLYLLLMLNCGFYQGDIADLTPSEVDWKHGRIVRARSKKEKAKKQNGSKVIKVNWLLWSSTFELLKKIGNRTGERVLTNINGAAPVVGGINDNGKTWRKDNIRSAFARVVTKLKNRKKLPKSWHKTLKQLRKTGANILEKSKEHGEFYELYLDHSSVAKRHYLTTGEPVPKFDDAVMWLGKELGLGG